jgi:hypothetical protein
MARKTNKWMKIESKWKCKVGTCIIVYCAKWLLTKHLKEVHGLVTEKAKHGRPSIFERGLQHQDNVEMNVYILRDVMAMQRRNDQKVANRTHAKAQCKWHTHIIVAKQCPPLPKPILVKLASK